jgi:hypothetical protein
MPREKLVNRPEAIRWLAEGRTYAACVQAHLDKYNVQTAPSTWAKLRAQAGLARRLVRDDTLIPWDVKVEHRWAYPLVMLRFEAKRRAGKTLTDLETAKLDPFLQRLNDQQQVIMYDASTVEGFFFVPRLASDDDIIRKPTTGLTKRHAGD